MEVRFDANTAEYLISQMDSYCLSLQKDAVDLLDILEFSGRWEDPQMKTFYQNIIEISKDLEQALKLESEYMNVFIERVRELRS